MITLTRDDKNLWTGIIIFIVLPIIVFWAASHFHWFESDDDKFAREFCEKRVQSGEIPSGEMDKCKIGMLDTIHELKPTTICSRETTSNDKYIECLKDFESGRRLVSDEIEN